MKEFFRYNDSKPYGTYYFKDRLKDHYGHSIHISEGQGLNDIVTMRYKADTILRN